MSLYFERDGIAIFHGDCREILPTLAVDLVVTDPPYGTGGWRRLERGQGSKPYGSLVSEAWDDGATDWLALTICEVICAFCPPAWTYKLLSAAQARGLDKHRCLFMKKRDPKPMVAGRTRWSVEPIWVLSREGLVLHGGEDLIEVSTPRLGRDLDGTGHPYQKPIEALLWTIQKLPSGSILDPFMGSGTTLVAALSLGRTAIGIEQDERWCEVAANRLSQLPLLAGFS